MKRPMQFLVASAGMLLLALTLVATNPGQVIGQSIKPLLVEVINSSARPVPVVPTPVAADYVTLEDAFDEPGDCPYGTSTERVRPDGAREPFAVPRGRVLVLTDMQGVVSMHFPVVWNSSHVGFIATLRASVHGVGQTQYLEAQAQLNAAGVSAQALPVQIHLQSGIVAGPNSIVCLNGSVGKPNYSLAADAGARLQGFLMNQ